MTSSSEPHSEKPEPAARRDGFSAALFWLLVFVLPLMFYHYWIAYRGWVHPLFFWLSLLAPALFLIEERWRRRRVARSDEGQSVESREEQSESLAGRLALLLLVLLGVFYWSGWLVWASIAFFLTGFQHDPARDEVSGVSFGRRALGVAALALLVLIMAPEPHRFMQPLGIACPYL